MTEQIIQEDLGQGAWLSYDPQWLDEQEADQIQQALLADYDWQARTIIAGHKQVVQPRLMAWAGELPYHYSGQTLEPCPLSPTLKALNETLSQLCGVAFNHVVLNLYRDGHDHVGMHADDEPELGHNPVIASVSLGEARRFYMENRHKRSRKKTLRLTHGSLLIMGGSFQHKWRHALLKQPQVTEPRLNLTFRQLMGPPGWRQPRQHPHPSAPPSDDSSK